MLRSWLCLLLLLSMSLSATAAPTLAMLLNDLASGDNAPRTAARVLLPHHGISAIPGTLRLLTHEDPRIWRAARNVLADITNATTAPGHEDERAEAAGLLVTALGEAQTTELQDRLLRLLMPVLGPGDDHAPIVALLDADDDLIRQRARQTLEEAGTPEARAALRQRLEGLQGEGAVPYLNALAHLRDAESVPLAAARLDAPSWDECLAAARAVAWTGDPQFAPAMKRLLGQMDEEHRSDSANAVLRYADAMAARGGNVTGVVALYRALLDATDDTTITNAALAGLGRHGDESTVPLILARAEENLDLASGALAGLRAIATQGLAGQTAIDAAYAEAGALKFGLLPVLGSLGTPGALEHLRAATNDADDTMAHAAIDALALALSGEAVDALASVARGENPARAEHARAALQRLAMQVAGKDANAAGLANLALYQTAPDEDAKQAAFDGIQAYPTPEAWAELAGAMSTEQVAALETPFLVAVAKRLYEDGRGDDAAKAFDEVLARTGEPGVAQQVLDTFGPIDTGINLVERLGFLTQWQAVGPLPWSKDEGFQNHVDVTTLTPGTPVTVGDMTAEWQELNVGHAGTIDLMGPFGTEQNRSVYLLTTVERAEAGPAELRLGSDDGVRAWVNGAEVHANNTDRGTAIDSDVVPVTLNAGTNTIVLQITQNGGGWGFVARLAEAPPAAEAPAAE